MNITAQDNLRYALDTLNTENYGVIRSKNYAVDCTKADKVSGFKFTHNIDNNSAAYFLFFESGGYYRLNPDGTINPVSETLSFDILRTYGNTLQELAALNNIPAFARKSFGFAIGLSSQNAALHKPRIKFSLLCESGSKQLAYSAYSPEYYTGEIQALSFSADTQISEGASCNVFAQYRDLDGNLSPWQDIGLLKGKIMDTIHFRADFSVPGTSQGSAVLNAVKMLYSAKDKISASAGSADIFSRLVNWHMNIKNARMTIKHSPLINSQINAFVSLRKEPGHAINENLGIGSGAARTFQLKYPHNVIYDSINLYFDGVKQFSSYEINSQAGRITCTPPEGVIVSCDYDYDYDYETWHKMKLSSRVLLDDCCLSEFRLELPDSNFTAACVRIQLVMNEGAVSGENLGRSDGSLKSYKLSHTVKNGLITIYANGAPVSQKNYFLHDDQQHVSVSVQRNLNITADYSWISETPEIYQFAAVFSQ